MAAAGASLVAVAGAPRRQWPVPTPRMALLVALCSMPLAVTGWIWLSLALSLLLLAAAGVDLALSGRRLAVQRRVPPVLLLGAENRIELEVRDLGRRGGGGHSGVVELRDALPFHIRRCGEWPRVRLQARTATGSYTVVPGRRGQYGLGPLHARHASPLGLWQRRQVWPALEPVRVYPNLSAARKWEIAVRQGRQLDGLKRSRRRGSGTEFESLREYHAGDPFRAINWPATARAGRPITTLYQVDRSQPIMLVIDAGRVMTPEIRGLSRLDHVLQAALLLATVAAERGDQCGLMLFGSEVRAFRPPGKGRGQVLAMVEAVYDARPEQVEPDYARMIAWLQARHRKRSLVVVFTEMADRDVSRSLVEQLSRLATRHLVLVVCLADPELVRLARQLPERSAQVYDKAAALEVVAQRAETIAQLTSRGIHVVDVPVDEFSTAVINNYLSLKDMGRI